MEETLYWGGEDTAVTFYLLKKAEVQLNVSALRYKESRDEAFNRLVWRGAQIAIPMASGKQVGLKKPGSNKIELIKAHEPSWWALFKHGVKSFLVRLGVSKPVLPQNVKVTIVVLERVWLAMEEAACLLHLTKTDALNRLLLLGLRMDEWLGQSFVPGIVIGEGPNSTFGALDLD